MPHDECPMAVTLKTGRPVRDVEAIAERPDGSRYSFTPYPTPLYDAAGTITGAVNMLIDPSERKRAAETAPPLAAIVASSDDAKLGRASCREECVSKCKSRWSPDH